MGLSGNRLKNLFPEFKLISQNIKVKIWAGFAEIFLQNISRDHIFFSFVFKRLLSDKIIGVTSLMHNVKNDPSSQHTSY